MGRLNVSMDAATAAKCDLPWAYQCVFRQWAILRVQELTQLNKATSALVIEFLVSIMPTSMAPFLYDE